MHEYASSPGLKSTAEFEPFFAMEAQSTMTLFCGVAGCSVKELSLGVRDINQPPPPHTMAQWAHQFSGLTHETKVIDCEMTLRRAVERLKQDDHPASPPPDFTNLAERLIAARRKAMRARLAKLREPLTIELSAHEIENAEARLAALESRGVPGILREFAVPESFAPPIGA